MRLPTIKSPVLNPGTDAEIHNGIYLLKTGDLEGEAYELKIGSDSILLAAGTAEGAFRGIQTLRQLLFYLNSLKKQN